MLRKFDDLSYLQFLMLVVLFVPQFQNNVGLIIEQALSLIILMAVIIYLVVTGKSINIKHLFFIFFFLLLIIVSLMRNLFSEFVYNDIFELAKPLYLGFSFVLAYSIEWDDSKIKSFLKILALYFILLSVFGVFESTTNFGNNIGTLLYKDLRDGVQYKAVASFISPYVFASILILFVCYFLLLLVSDFKWRYFSFFLLFLLCLLLTQSRTVFIALVLTMVLFTIYMILTNNFSAKNKYITMVIVFLIFLAICLPILIIYAKNNLEYLYNGLNLVYERLLNFHFNDFIYSSPSITSRYEQLMFVMNSIDQIPLIGVGIGKAVLMPESFYALYLYRVGVIGILMHVVMLILAFKKCSELAVKYKYDVSLNCFFMSFQFYLISLPFSYASSALNDQVRSGFIFYVLLGMVFKCSDNFKKV